MLPTSYQNASSTTQSVTLLIFYLLHTNVPLDRYHWSSQRKFGNCDPLFLSAGSLNHSLLYINYRNMGVTKTVIFHNMDRMGLVGSSMERGRWEWNKNTKRNEEVNRAKSMKREQNRSRWCGENLFRFQNITWTHFNVLFNEIVFCQISVWLKLILGYPLWISRFPQKYEYLNISNILEKEFSREFIVQRTTIGKW